MLFEDSKPIVACSTPTTINSALALIRISGFADIKDLQRFFSCKLSEIRPRYVSFCNILHEDKVLDQGLLTFFQAPFSYTGENVIELTIHGNQLNIQRILSLFVEKASMRLAGPGEFTWRALKNKKMSFSQVEGLDLILNASSPLVLDQGLDVLQGGLKSEYQALYDLFLQMRACLELNIDFSEDVGDEESRTLFFNSLKNFTKKVSSLYSRTQGLSSSLLLPEIVLVGQANAGKSTLFNSLLSYERSIVTAKAGTTRDFVSESFHYKDICFRLVDTAGFRETSDDIEVEGISRSLGLIKKAFFKVLVVNPFESLKEDFNQLKSIHFDLVIFSHSDLSGFSLRKKEVQTWLPMHDKQLELNLLESGPIGPKSEAGPIGPGEAGGSIGPSLASGPIEPRTQVIEIIYDKYRVETEKNPIILERHRYQIAEIHSKLQDFNSIIRSEEKDVGVLSSELMLLGQSVYKLIGIIPPENVLNSIFSNFCIGK